MMNNKSLDLHLAKARHAFPNRDTGKILAAPKYIFSYTRYTSRNRYTRQADTTKERIISDARQTFRERDTLKAIAPMKRIELNTLDTLR